LKDPGLPVPSVSVVIPTWNRADTLSKAIESVLSQSLPVLEVLVCDDGSTDGTAEVVMAMARHDPRIRWLPGERGGRPAIPRNRGIAASRGEWLAFLDSDDAWERDKLAVQLDAAQRLDCLAVCSNALRVFPGAREPEPLLDWNRPLLKFSHLLAVNRVVCSSCVVHRSVLARTGGFPADADFKAIEDYALWLRVAAITCFAYCSATLVRYRDDPESSLRAQQDVSPASQKKLVLQNLVDWLRTCPGALPGRRGILARVEIARSWDATRRIASRLGHLLTSNSPGSPGRKQ
jgi:glycosyltransferase involved in cell wall biosynthesis